MAMGKRRRHAKQAWMWVATQDRPGSAAPPFYTRLNQMLEKHDVDSYVKGWCQPFYARTSAARGATFGQVNFRPTALQLRIDLAALSNRPFLTTEVRRA